MAVIEATEKIWNALTLTWDEYRYIPSSHASTASTYGLGTTTNYGHVKTINALTQSSHADGTALSAYQGYLLNINKAPNSHASTATTYGVGSTTAFGHLKVGEGIAVSSGVISLSNHGSAATIGSSTTLGIATHKNKTVLVTAASACNITIPLNSSVAFPIGTHIDFIQEGAGEVTFVPTSGVTMQSEGSKTKINARYQAATLIKTATDTWYLIGAIK